MDIRQLEYFVEVAKQLSFTRAATTLHISQPSLSKAIQNMEADLGVPLFYRSSKQLELTDAGQITLANAQHIINAFENLYTELTDIMELKKGKLRIGIPPIVGAEFFSKLITAYKEHYPFIEIALTEVGSKSIRTKIDQGELDIGLVCSATSPNEQLETMPFLNDPLHAIVHEDHPLAHREKIHLSELKDAPFIMYRNDFVLYDRIIEECSKNDFFPIIACETSQKDLFIEMVQAKLGVALLPQKIAEKIPYSTIKVIPFYEQPIDLELGISWRRNKYLPSAVREFIRLAEKFNVR